MRGDVSRQCVQYFNGVILRQFPPSISLTTRVHLVTRFTLHAHLVHLNAVLVVARSDTLDPGSVTADLILEEVRVANTVSSAVVRATNKHIAHERYSFVAAQRSQFRSSLIRW